MARPRSEATERWHAEKAAVWGALYGGCRCLEDVVATSSAFSKRCAAVINRVAEKPIDIAAFHREVDAIREGRGFG